MKFIKTLMNTERKLNCLQRLEELQKLDYCISNSRNRSKLNQKYYSTKSRISLKFLVFSDILVYFWHYSATLNFFEIFWNSKKISREFFHFAKANYTVLHNTISLIHWLHATFGPKKCFLGFIASFLRVFVSFLIILAINVLLFVVYVETSREFII